MIRSKKGSLIAWLGRNESLLLYRSVRGGEWANSFIGTSVRDAEPSSRYLTFKSSGIR